MKKYVPLQATNINLFKTKKNKKNQYNAEINTKKIKKIQLK